jgi:cell division protein ftsZ
MSLAEIIDQATSNVQIDEADRNKVRYYKERFSAFEKIINDENYQINELKLSNFQGFTSYEQNLKDIDKDLVDMASSAMFINEFSDHSASIGLDISDIKNTMALNGMPVIVRGISSGQNAIQNATKQAMRKLLSSEAAVRSVVAWFEIDESMEFSDLTEAINIIEQHLEPDSDIVFGTTSNVKNTGAANITILAMVLK